MGVGSMDEVVHSDADLVTRTCSGEAQAFGALVSRHEGHIYNAVVHLVGSGPDAEDIAQEVFMKAFRGLGGFRGRASFSTWLYGIMLNCVRTHWPRKRSRTRVFSLNPGTSDEDQPFDPPSPQDGPVESSVRSETIEMVRHAIGELPGELREVVVLRDIEGLSYDEMSRALGMPLGTVKSRLFRARLALKERIAPALADGG